jgi:hypothetical protein
MNVECDDVTMRRSLETSSTVPFSILAPRRREFKNSVAILSHGTNPSIQKGTKTDEGILLAGVSFQPQPTIIHSPLAMIPPKLLS